MKYILTIQPNNIWALGREDGAPGWFVFKGLSMFSVEMMLARGDWHGFVMSDVPVKDLEEFRDELLNEV